MGAPAEQEILALQKAAAGRFSIERELGRGGMGIVMLARDVTLERLVAIKLLPAALSNIDTRARFVREARTSARLAHPNVVPIHSVEDHDKLVFFVMGYVDGETLAERVRRAGPLSAADGARFVQEMAWALAYAHSAGVVHRDVKPDNVLIDRASGRAMLTDFGIARVTDEPTLSGRGEVLGTAQFVSPEQASGGKIDGRSDIYSLGVTAFYALSGRLPFEAPTLLGLLGAHVTQTPPPLATVQAGLPPRLVAAIDRCLLKDPAARFQSGEELANAVAKAIAPASDEPAAVPPPWSWASLVLAASSLARFLGVSGKLPSVGPRTAAFKPTEAFLAEDVSQLISALPASARGRTGDANEVIGKLLLHVARLRAREEELAEAIVQAGVVRRSQMGIPAPSESLIARRAALTGEITDAVAGVASRRESALAAMENIRIQLVRLRSGLSSLEDFTADLDAAIKLDKELGEFSAR